MVDPGLEVDPVRGGALHPHGASGRALRVQDAGSLSLTRTCTHTNSRYPSSGGDFQPARWTPVPAGAGTMCHLAGKIRPQQARMCPFYSCWLRLDGSGSCPARTGEVADRISEPDRRLNREPPRRPVFRLGMW